jgi:hypothetical protein
MPKQGDAKVAIKFLNDNDVVGSKIRVKKRPNRNRLKEIVRDSTQLSKSSTQDPLHGVTLEMVVTRLLEKYGWEELGRQIKINCFISDPSIASRLKFLRKTPWARQKVEALYLRTQWPTS